MATKEYLLNNLHGLDPIDWEQATKDYNIAGFNPAELNVVQRDDVMLSLVETASQAPLERAIYGSKLPEDATAEAKELRNLARAYIVLANKNARLPKFSKWVSSMFAGNDKLMMILSKAGQNSGKQDIIISCNPIDILRGADSKHFWSCLGANGGFREVLKGVVTRCPGVAVAYVDHPEDGKMKCRVWLNHGIVNGKDVIVMMNPYGNGFTKEHIAKIIADKGYDVYQSSYYNEGGVKFELVNTFDWKGKDKGVHWDILEYEQKGVLLAKATCEPKINLKKRAA